MIGPLPPLAADGIGFASLASLCILAAWYAPAAFPLVLATASAVVALSWLHGLDLAVLAVFLVPPYAVARWTWGRPERADGKVIVAAIALQTAMFLVIKGYPGASLLQPWAQPVAVVGISYMLFRQLQLMIDAPNMGDVKLTPYRYLTWLLAFWTLLAGPIQRYGDFVAGLKGVHRPGRDEALAAAHRAVNGFIKAFVLAPVLLGPSKVTLLARPGSDWLDLAVIFYTFPFYLYLNFAGYTDMMIGIARLCGFTTLPENFNAPYLARNCQEFWGRWHMSLSSWIRDYLFAPLSLAIHRRLPARFHSLALAAAVMMTFVVVGAWHGTTGAFIVFGLMHGVGVLAVAVWDGLLKKRLGRAARKAFVERPWVRVTATVLTFHYVAAAMALVNNSLEEITVSLSAFLRL
ncbi:Conserved protein of unknowm function [Magnetospirillum sp. XM-1]|uniref:MBOAT family O-acyltransferase n=1 Tax=Magnetospirillum sp. XM-1 TaxID=1663591 RepID=UPI00073DC37C|nr:MBOAT family O-acyltransferase [Magnetospirillum sp. XM-1]CUW38095.1 Conserved protein of unknowm function [Magnetospirillum sp. XM-1]